MLIERVNDYICNPHISSDRGRKGYYPSEASAIDRNTGVCLGKCLRAAYYSWSNVEKTNPVDARGNWTFAFGSAIEHLYTQFFKEIGIWRGNNVKFYDRVRNISGEVDIFVVNLEGSIIGVEIKTAYGYGFQKNIKVAPKPENLMQVGLYLDNFPDIKYWILIYHSRDTQEQVEYHVSRGPNNNLIINHAIPINNWTMDDVYVRYDQLGQALMTKTEPKQDFTYMYTMEESVKRFAMGTISKTKMGKVEKKTETDSDWHCLYCGYLDHCWKEKRASIKLKGV